VPHDIPIAWIELVNASLLKDLSTHQLDWWKDLRH
jgi:hypothetical protein